MAQVLTPYLSHVPWGNRNRNRNRRSCAKKPSSSSSSSSLICCTSFNQTVVGQELLISSPDKEKDRVGRIFFLDVNPLCYKENTPSLQSFSYWISLFFQQVTLTDPVVAVFDGEGGNDYRRQLLPSYKAHRRRFSRQFAKAPQLSRGINGRLHHLVTDILQRCNVPVVKIGGYEADDVIATLSEQALQSGLRVVIGSPDKDFKQLISEDVQIVMPMPDLGRWSFYTLKHYVSQYSCDPSSDLSLRCILGDEVDGVPGIQHVAPGFGRKTALKLLKKHGSLENLLNASKIRSVGKEYVQEALTKHADYLRKNYEVLSLRKDVDVHLEKEWLGKRDTCDDAVALSDFTTSLEESEKLKYQNRPWSSSTIPPTS